MDGKRFGHRIAIVRNGRRYSACGIGGYRARGRHAKRRAHRAGLLPGATLALIVLFAAVALGYPPIFPDNPQHRTPIVGVAHYTFADFVNAGR